MFANGVNQHSLVHGGKFTTFRGDLMKTKQLGEQQFHLIPPKYDVLRDHSREVALTALASLTRHRPVAREALTTCSVISVGRAGRGYIARDRRSAGVRLS